MSRPKPEDAATHRYNASVLRQLGAVTEADELDALADELDGPSCWNCDQWPCKCGATRRQR